jgi:hypothetical protein
MQDGAAYALVLLLALLESKTTLYLLAWAKPLGLGCVRTAIEDALENLESWSIPADSLLSSNLTEVYEYMSCSRLRHDHALVRRGPASREHMLRTVQTRFLQRPGLELQHTRARHSI